MKKIVLLTTGQPATNPRLVKEANSLAAAGYDITVLYCHFIQWATDVEKGFLRTAAWKYKLIGGSPQKNKLRYFFTRLRFRLARAINHLLSPAFWAERAQARAYDELLQAAIKLKADLYIGHNLGALAVAVSAAKFHGVKAGFDFEDYYRGEYPPGDKNRERIAWLENRYLPELSYYSFSSPLIAEVVRRNHPKLSGLQATLLNCFPLEEQPVLEPKQKEENLLKLWWFSQTVGENRGLETVVSALEKLNNTRIQLTLVGRCTEEMKASLLKRAGRVQQSIHFAGVISPAELPVFASQFDVGLATETGFSENNHLALSNKLFTYLLAGNAIILSSTRMQKMFNDKYRIGQVYTIDKQNELIDKINFYLNPKQLETQRIYNYALAKAKLNWNLESSALLHVIERL